MHCNTHATYVVQHLPRPKKQKTLYYIHLYYVEHYRNEPLGRRTVGIKKPRPLGGGWVVDGSKEPVTGQGPMSNISQTRPVGLP